MTSKEKRPPLIVLGIDAGDHRFIQEWAAEGHLPAISSIIEDGFSGRTAGPELVTEHGVWISIFSGLSRGQHGYYYFRQLVPGTYGLKSVTGLEVDAPPFWSRFGGTGVKSLVIDAADTKLYPGIPGVQVANWATHNNWDPDHFVTASEPPAVIEDIKRRFDEKLVVRENHSSTFGEDLEIYAKLLTHVEKKGEMSRYLLEKDAYDLSVIIFGESHAANHQFWKYHRRNREKGSSDNELTDAILNVYKAIDREIGRIIESRKDANICILSSVGMEDDFPNAALSEALCRLLGWQAAPEADGISFRPIDIARRLLPESVRVALTRGLSRDKREQLLSDGFTNGTDWKRTRAFSIPVSYTGFIRVNLKGREPEGIVSPGAEYTSLLDEIEAALTKLRDAETGEPAVVSVSRVRELFGEDSHPALPDLFVEFKPGRFMDRVTYEGKEISMKRPEFFRRSDHSCYGFFALSGPSITKRGPIGDISVLDIAPTLLSLLGRPVPEDMKGLPLEL